MTEQGKKDFIMEQDNMGQDNRKQQLRESSEGLSREERMASSSIGSLVVSMAFPAILAQLINILYSIIDRIYIGHTIMTPN